ncbi:VOC family protein [Methylovirgula sp. 4M-Z18]|uniref:VOC family protein n=1 Tax=Methylovirgula sp. 4M-Z18 TaxID=2293567 RepID=UPI000E2F41EE|nr:VOC family protein [Methylovirgula sp. 4M-Z18]RFB79640.1 glyoxalase [Methylovirgula sp. 4M-Z18]
MSTYHAPAQTRIGHIHLKVADLGRAVAFYRDLMGFDLNFQLDSFAFLSVGGYHHHIALNTWESKGASPRRGPGVGLYHFALNYPTRKDLARALQRLVEAGYPIDGSADHGSHLAIYLNDPDGNGIELAWDRDPSYWSDWIDGQMTREKARELNKPFDLVGLLREELEPA